MVSDLFCYEIQVLIQMNMHDLLRVGIIHINDIYLIVFDLKY